MRPSLVAGGRYYLIGFYQHCNNLLVLNLSLVLLALVSVEREIGRISWEGRTDSKRRCNHPANSGTCSFLLTSDFRLATS